MILTMKRIEDMLKLNKGEWSEPYCLLKVMSDKKLFLCEPNLSSAGISINVTGGRLSDNVTYRINDDAVSFSIKNNEKEYSFAYLQEIAANVLVELKKSQPRTFPIAAIEQLFSEIGNPSIKSKSSNKSDCLLSVYDDLINSEEDLNFSIKSFLAGSPTLINASKATNFTFKVETDNQQLKELKAKALIRNLNKNKSAITFTGMDSDVYFRNLMLIDTQMPLIISEVLKIYFGSKIKLISEIVKILEQTNPLNISDVSLYKNKISDFLFYSSTGMFPNKKWEGIQNIDGGCIIVKDDGELATFYIFRRSFLVKFREYLYSQCFLDTASTTKHGFGRLYRENDRTNLKLNLQVRIQKN